MTYHARTSGEDESVRVEEWRVDFSSSMLPGTSARSATLVSGAIALLFLVCVGDSDDIYTYS